MIVVNMHEAKTNLSKLVRQVEAGEEVIVSRGGEPVAKIVPYTPPAVPRRPGRMKGQIKILPGFDEIPPEFEEYLP
ncbi:MAG: type II toxin-antitoxin system Phd/YefM family antitoxin [Actinobacteria bacterium]|nr:type II toxin-antitoxin system Phd/YefM family antitoxin [Actinomycetota bacterium]